MREPLAQWHGFKIRELTPDKLQEDYEVAE